MAACTDEEPVEEPEPEFETSIVDGPQTLDSSGGLTNLQPAVFGDVQTVDEDTISVEFEMLSPECYGYEPVIQESEDDVAVAIQIGLLEGKTEEDCEYDLNNWIAEIDLENPIGDRDLKAAEELEPTEAP